MTEGMVYFVGAGPGSPDLITVRGQQVIQHADVIIFADSLVHPDVCKVARPDAELHGSSSLTLEEVLSIVVKAVHAGKVVARIHSGDPSIYGAIHEQMVALDREGISYTIVPGVTSAAAAAAALGAELTVPEVSQTVIFTRVGGRTGLPGREHLTSFAEHGVTMAIFLSTALIERVVSELLNGGYVPITPVAVVYRATWEDELILRGTLEDIAAKVRAAKLAKQAIIMVGKAFDPALHTHGSAYRSHLYDGTYTHMFRKGTWRRQDKPSSGGDPLSTASTEGSQ
ncbi:MAG: precorrin-4 C(11)-methyltransferase [Chloroflexi bacterium]|nr:precorrin-4 C(11)-methyltransferase [Chloroflexota bacterium]